MLEATFWIISYCVSICNAQTVHSVSKYAVKPAIHHVVKPTARVAKKVLQEILWP